MGIVSNMCVGGGKGHDNFSFSINPRWGGESESRWRGEGGSEHRALGFLITPVHNPKSYEMERGERRKEGLVEEAKRYERERERGAGGEGRAEVRRDFIHPHRREERFHSAL